MHGPGNGLVHYARNPYNSEVFLYFISDPPHLIKTTRNCFSNSYSHFRSRKLWNHQDISWMDIVSLFENYCELNCFNPCPKLKRSHIDLTPFSRMNVSLATQVLSKTVSCALDQFIGGRVSELSRFLNVMNKWFDLLNTKSFAQSVRGRNENLYPYCREDDQRLCWLENEFLSYFEQWKHNVENRPGVFTDKQKSCMQLSYQTLNGLTITTKSIVHCIKFLLHKGAPFVLTGHFNQDPLEQLFGHLRHKGGANDNPTVFEATHALNTIRVVNTQAICPKRGNTSVADEPELDNTPVPRRPAHRG